MLFKVDTRESNKELFDGFDVLSKQQGFEWKKEFLEVGDIACGNVIIERKEAGDFVASIMDGRLKEQAAKMCLNYEHRYIIVEGNPFNVEGDMHPHSIIGKMTSLLVKQNIKLVFVNNPFQCAYACFSLVQKHLANDTFNPEEFQTKVYKINDKDVIVRMLYQIPGLGIDKSKIIANKYNNSLKTLVEKVSKEDLTSIEGIGDVMANRVVDLFKQ